MSDNSPLPLAPGSTRNAATDQVTHSGDVADVQLVRLVDVVGAEGSKTVAPRKVLSFHGRSCTFKTPGRAAVSQKILSIHNAAASAVLVDIQRIRVDVLNTAVKAVTVVVPVVRVVRYSAAQTNGTVLAKGAIDTIQASNASVTVTGDASADGTLSATTLTLTPTGTLAQAYACRVFTAVGYEIMDTVEFFLGDTDITLRAGEGLAVFLDAAVVTTGIPATDAYISSVDWVEYTAA